MPNGGPLERFLPDLPADDREPWREWRRRSARASTFIASLELAKQGHVALAQEDTWTVIEVKASDSELLLRHPVPQGG
jgi:chromatin segregation and condensation protein Rec8/ScpA/Scc1 (kleisin family)